MKLAELTTLRVGGEARELVSGSTADELIQLARSTWAEGQPWLALGGGSNLVISDGGFDGTVIRVLNRGIEQLGGGSLRVQAGENWDDVVAFAIEHGLAGIEALSGIPGSAGAGPVQNIGAYGQEIAECLDSIDFLDEITGERQRLRAEELELGYRTSTLKQGRRGILLSIDLKLEQGGSSAPVRYAQLASALGVEIGERVALASVREAVLRLRASKGMLLDPSDPDSVSVGSFFTNPIVSENFARSLPAEAPRWLIDPDAPESDVKLSAAWLIEKAGIRRGFSLPGSAAAISSKHTLAIVNTGGATAEQVVELARYIHLRVLND
ncbi:MAG: UDP-N-acetylmuramate dehydrogenase, partial [Cryobacterium sp.]|nr:UDP-N-acetylmuramate dehydrogenase [Cryobacterium sp.]